LSVFPIRYNEYYKNAKYVVMEMITTRRHPTHLHEKTKVQLSPSCPTRLEVSRASSLLHLLNLWGLKDVANEIGREDKKTSDLKPINKYDDDFLLDDSDESADENGTTTKNKRTKIVI